MHETWRHLCKKKNTCEKDVAKIVDLLQVDLLASGAAVDRERRRTFLKV